MTQQVYLGSFTNPNSELTPLNPQLAALYYNDKCMTVIWGWSVMQQAWYLLPQVIVPTPKQFYSCAGNPNTLTVLPVDGTVPCLCLDTVTKFLYSWDNTAHTWV